MKERLTTFGLALGALVVFYTLFVPKAADLDEIASPVSTEGRDEGYQGAWRWLRSQGVPVASFRERYFGLERQQIPATGNLMFSTMPHKVPARADEAAALDTWLRRGNTLLLVAALNDTPRWAVGAPADFLDTLEDLTGLQFVAMREAAPDDPAADDTSPTTTLRQTVLDLLEPDRGSIVPRGSHPLLDGVRSVATVSEFPASRWTARAGGALALELAEVGEDRRGGTSDPALWLRRHGEGQVIVLAHASPFTNALLGTADNATLFGNIVARALGPAGAVLFDDSHQGLVSYYDAKAFFADPRLHRTLLWLGLLWLVFVLGWQRLRPETDGWQPADVTSFIKVTGEFIAGRVAPDAVARRLYENFFNTIRRRLALPANGEPLWDWLATQSSLPEADLQQLQQLYQRALTGQRVNLVTLHNCLTNITGRLA